MNGSGHKSGQYCSDEQAAVYRSRLEQYLRDRNAAWLDRWVDWWTGEVAEGVPELPGVWRADSYIAEWCCRTGRLARASVPLDGIKARQIGYLTGICYFRSEADRRALAFETKRFIDAAERDMAAAIRRGDASVRTG